MEVHREPGSTRLGDRVRELLLNGAAVNPEAEMFLFMAARAELIGERILPALRRGAIVILDRYHDSTLAYQGARGVRTFWPESFPRPDLAGKAPDRFEAEADDFHSRVVAEYDRLAGEEPERFLVVDADQPADAVAERVWERVSQLLPVTAS